MRSKLFRMITAVLMMALLLGLGAIAYAQQTDVATKDGITVSLLTDKEDYTGEESILLSVRVTNTSEKTAQITAQVETPSSLQVKTDKDQQKASVNPGEEDTLLLEIGKTSLLSVLLPWLIGGVAVIGCGVAVLLLARKKHRTVSAILCFMLVCAGLLTAMPVQAADGSQEITVSCNVKVDGVPVKLSVSVSYEMVEAVYTREALENALVASAWSYFLKEDKLQYCSQEITDGLSKYTGGNYRLTEDAAPEYGTSDTTIYSVCSDFVYKTYYEAFGHRLLGAENYLGATTSDFWLKSEDVALMRWIQAIYQMDEMDAKYGVTREKELTTEGARKFMENWEENLRPGDVIVFTGHAFLYVGNGYVMDCWGDKYNEPTGLDYVEANGSVHVLHTVEDLFLNGTDPVATSYVIMFNCIKEWLVVFRPLDAFVQEADAEDMGRDIMSLSDISEKPEKLNVTHSRQANPAMEIDRTVDITPYGTVATGEKLTYSVAISNKSNDPDYLTYRHYAEPAYAGQAYTGLVVTETVPEGTVLVEGSISHGGVFQDGVITWTLDIPAGETAELTYQVKVTAPIGSTIVNDGGFVADIPSNSISNTVGGQKLSEEALAGLTELAETPKAQWREDYNISKLGTDLEFAERVYQAAMGIDLELPTIEQILNNLYTFRNIRNESCSDRFPAAMSAKLFEPKDTVPQEYQQVADMMVAGYYGGQKLYNQVRGLTINEFSFDYLEPGDILAYAITDVSGMITRTEVSVYAGDGTLLVMDSRQRTEVLHISTLNNADHAYAKLWNALARDMFFVLRPSQVYEDMNTMVYDTAKEPTYGEEPAEYVSPLGGYTLNDEYLKALAELNADLNEDGTNQWLTKNTNFAEEVYLRIGLDITSGTQSVSIANILKTAVFFDADGLEIAPYSYNFLATPAETYQQLAAMLVRELRGGPYMQGCEDNLISISDLQPGDILNLINREDSRYWVCIYQGNGKLLTSEYTKGSRQTYQVYDFSNDTDGSAFKEFITNSAIGGFPWECFYVMRPSQGFYNINDPTFDPNYKTPDITTGTYAILAKVGDEYYALQSTTDKYKVHATKVEYENGKITGSYDTWAVNVLKELGTGLSVRLSANDNYIFQKVKSSSNISLRLTPSDITNWRLLYDEERECYRLQTQSGDNRYLMYSTTNEGFKVYSQENSAQYGELLLVPVNSFDLKSGEYAVIAKAGDKYYAMSNTMRDKVTMDAVQVTKQGNGFAGTDVETWKLTSISKNGNITLSAPSGEYLIRTKDSSNLGLGDKASNWAVYKNSSTGYYTIRNTNGDTRLLSFNGTGFKAYNRANDTRFTEILLVPASQISGLKAADMDTHITLDAGSYAVVAVVGDKYYAMSDAMHDGYSMKALEVNVKDGKLTTANVPAWNLTVQDDKGTVTLATGAGKYLNRRIASSNLSLSSSQITWNMVRSKSTGYYTIASTNEDSRYLSYNGTAFKAYEKASDTHFIRFMLIPVDPFAQMESGEYALIAKAGEQYFAMSGSMMADGVTMGAVQVTEENGIFTGSGVDTWNLRFMDTNGSISLANEKGEYLLRDASSSNLGLGESAVNWTLYKDSTTGFYTVRNTNGDTRFLSYNGTGFKAYAKASDSRFIELLLVPAANISQAKVQAESGYYALVAIAGDKYYAVGNSANDGVVDAMEVTLENGELTGTNVDGWNLTVLDDQGTVTLTTPDGKYLVRTKSSSNLGTNDTETNWKLAQDDAGYYTISNENGDSRYLSYNGTGFKAYAAASETRFIQFTLIPIPEPELEPEQKLETGYYAVVAVAGDKYYAMGNTVDGGVAAATEVALENGVLTTNVDGWHVTVLDDQGTITLTDADGKYLGRTKSSSNLGIKDTGTSWTLAKDQDGYYTLANENGDSRYLSYNGTGFKAYAAASETRFIQFMLIELPEPEEKLETGFYTVVAVAGDKYYALSNSAQDAYSLQAMEVTLEDGAIATANVDFWQLTLLDEEGNVNLTTLDGKHLTRQKSSSNLSLGDTAVNWTLEKDENGYYTVTNENGDNRFLSYNGTAFKAYAAASDSRFVKFMLIPVTAQQVSSLADVVSGRYMVVTKHQDQYYAMTQTSDGYLMQAAQVQMVDGKFEVTPELIWNLTVGEGEAEKTVNLGFGTSYLRQTSKSSSNVSLNETAFDWKLIYDETTGTFRLQSSNSTRYLMYTTGSGGSFKVYASADENKSEELLLVKLS